MQLAFKKAVTDAIKKQPDRRVMPFLYENEPYFNQNGVFPTIATALPNKALTRPFGVKSIKS